MKCHKNWEVWLPPKKHFGFKINYFGCKPCGPCNGHCGYWQIKFRCDMSIEGGGD